MWTLYYEIKVLIIFIERLGESVWKIVSTLITDTDRKIYGQIHLSIFSIYKTHF